MKLPTAHWALSRPLEQLAVELTVYCNPQCKMGSGWGVRLLDRLVSAHLVGRAPAGRALLGAAGRRCRQRERGDGEGGAHVPPARDRVAGGRDGRTHARGWAWR